MSLLPDTLAKIKFSILVENLLVTRFDDLIDDFLDAASKVDDLNELDRRCFRRIANRTAIDITDQIVRIVGSEL